MEICWEDGSKAALDDEAGPVERAAPVTLTRQSELRLLESAGGVEVLAEETFVEKAHQLGGGLVVDGPFAGDDARRSRGEEGVGQSDQPLTRDRGAAAALAGAQDGEVRGQMEASDLVREQDAVLRLPLAIEERQRQARELRMGLIRQAVDCEVQAAVVLQLTGEDLRLGGLEAPRVEPRFGIGEGEDALGLVVGEVEARQVEQAALCCRGGPM